MTSSFLNHAHYVNSLAFIPATSKHPNGLVISGSSDKTIQVHDLAQPDEPLYILPDHQDNVCTLHAVQGNDEDQVVFASGSWDK
jgi:phospholipase A-2-activating protein